LFGGLTVDARRSWKHYVRATGCGVQHWREHGCLLSPKSDVNDPYEDRAYEYWEGDFVKTHYIKRTNSRAKKKQAEQASPF